MATYADMKKRGMNAFKKNYFVLVLVTLVATFLCNGKDLTTNYKELVSKLSNKGTSAVNAGMFEEQDTSAVEAVFERIIEGDTEGAKMITESAQEEINYGVPEAGLGGTKGTTSAVISLFSSGSILLTIFNAISGLTGSNNAAILIMLLVVLIAYILFVVFVTMMAEPVKARMALEARNYEDTPITRVFHFVRIKRWHNAAWTMLVTAIYQLLWSITIIGGFIKPLSYLLVPYIVAENPDMKANEAITLSRRMMKGHKLQALLFFLSFAGWFILTILTAGIFHYLFLGPYILSCTAEFYSEIRKEAKEKQIPGAEKLNDEYLYIHADRKTLETLYPEVVFEQANMTEYTPDLTGVKGFFAKVFGIWIGSEEERRKYQKYQNLKFGVDHMLAQLENRAYPLRLNERYKGKVKQESFNFTWLRVYTIWSVLGLFLLFGFIGWIWEVSLHLLQHQEFVNRGALWGPILPIYGAGGVLIVVLLNTLRKHPLIHMAGAAIVAGAVEYSIAKYLEDLRQVRYWNYKGFFLNLDGRICFEGILVFAVMGTLVVYLLAPMIDSSFSHIPAKIFIPVVIVLFTVYIGDNIVCKFYPHLAEGVSEDLCIGGWPQTLTELDELSWPEGTDEEKAEEQLKKDIEDNELLNDRGYYCTTKEQLKEIQNAGYIEKIRDGYYDDSDLEGEDRKARVEEFKAMQDDIERIINGEE